ncbi:MAG: 1,4-alpha-glucan branching protein GlgB [Pseudomonadales bacterium]
MNAPHPDSDALTRLIDGRHHAPYEVLGRFERGAEAVIRVFRPDAAQVSLAGDVPFTRTRAEGVFEWRGSAADVVGPYRLQIQGSDGACRVGYDPYAFRVTLADEALQALSAGRHHRQQHLLGAHPLVIDGVAGVRFAVWAPNAERVSVIGDFNDWDGRRCPMQNLGSSGVWCLFVPAAATGARYKFEIRQRASGMLMHKADPCAEAFELRPATASVVAAPSAHRWQDGEWMSRRARSNPLDRPMSIYEVHLGSWQRAGDGSFLDYRELASRLADHVERLGFTHVQLLPVMEHPFDGSWGYQTLGYFAPTSRFGSPDEFRAFVDHLHCRGIGVILDWVPGHFPRDAHGLARFDGTALYEHADPRLGEHPDWGTLVFNYGRNEVRSFLTSSALHWLEGYHADGLRVDAVASMLYLDYSREPGTWRPNRYGGNENLEAIDWLRELNTVAHGECPGVVIVAEESTSWPQVTRPTHLGGLGFTLKWNMGWMHDTLEYLSHDPIHRAYHHDRLTFGMLYAFTENFVLPFSHDEVVHGKRALLDKMPGDNWQRLANLRLLYTYQFTYPGKKLTFMGNEFADPEEWWHDRALDWSVSGAPGHRGVMALMRDLNALYRHQPALGNDVSGAGFEWIDCHDHRNSVITYLRRAGDETLVIALNFTPVPRTGYRIGVPTGGRYREILNSDSRYYGGSDLGNGLGIVADERPWMGRPHSLTVTLPPLAGIVLQPV